MKELYIKPEVEILLPLCEDIMTSSGEVLGGEGEGKPVNPNEKLPTDPSTPSTPSTPSDTYTDPTTEPDYSGTGDVGDIPGQ